MEENGDVILNGSAYDQSGENGGAGSNGDPVGLRSRSRTTKFASALGSVWSAFKRNATGSSFAVSTPTPTTQEGGYLDEARAAISRGIDEPFDPRCLEAMQRVLMSCMPELSDQSFDEWRKRLLSDARTNIGDPLYFLTWGEDGWTSFALESRAILRFSVLGSDLETVDEGKEHALTFRLPHGLIHGWSFEDAPVWISRLKLTSFWTHDDSACEVRIDKATRSRCSCSPEYFFDEADDGDQEEEEEEEKEEEEEEEGEKGEGGRGVGGEGLDGDRAIRLSKEDRASAVARELMDPDHLSKKSKDTWILKRHSLWGTILSKKPREALEGSVLRDYGPNKVVVERTVPAILAMEVALRSKIDPESKRDVERAFHGAGIDTFIVRKKTWNKLVDALEEDVKFSPISDIRIRVSRADGASWAESFRLGNKAVFGVGMFVEFVYDCENEKKASFANVLRSIDAPLSPGSVEGEYEDEDDDYPEDADDDDEEDTGEQAV